MLPASPSAVPWQLWQRVHFSGDQTAPVSIPLQFAISHAALRRARCYRGVVAALYNSLSMLQSHSADIAQVLSLLAPSPVQCIFMIGLRCSTSRVISV